MITKITSISELKQMFLEITLNKTDKVTDISKESVLNGIAYGCAKLAQKILVNLAILESHLFPETAYGTYLDSAAKRKGISARFNPIGSSTFLRISGDPGTYYQQDILTFISTSGVRFVLESSFTMPSDGYIYAKVKSTDVGLNTNVDPISINKMSPNISGHIACTNEFKATGGMDLESDEMYKIRIKDDVNRLSRNTLSYIEQVFIKINPEVLRIYKGGIDSDNKINFYVLSTSGRDFTDSEFNEIMSKSYEFLSLTELMIEDNDYNVKLNNINWLFVDLDFRANIDPSANIDILRRDMQIQVNKLFDYRFWKYGDVLEYENLLFAVKNVNGVRYIPDAFFTPHYDINVNKYRLPRVRGFILRDLDGNIIYDNNNVLNNFFYPNAPDNSFISTVLQTL